jgi:hypothetical protein
MQPNPFVRKVLYYYYTAECSKAYMHNWTGIDFAVAEQYNLLSCYCFKCYFLCLMSSAVYCSLL